MCELCDLIRFANNRSIEDVKTSIEQSIDFFLELCGGQEGFEQLSATIHIDEIRYAFAYLIATTTPRRAALTLFGGLMIVNQSEAKQALKSQKGKVM